MYIKTLFRELVQSYFPSLWFKAYYLYYYKSCCNLRSPKTFSEKLIWLRLNSYRNNTLILSLCDKYEVRNYLKNRGLGYLLTKLYFVTDNVDKVDFENLPNAFVLKCSQGCGTNYICRTGIYDKNELKNLINRWFKGNSFYDKDMADIGGINVNQLRKYILCEELLCDKDGNIPSDYKVYCFNGVPLAILYISDRFVEGEKKGCFMDKNWQFIGDTNESYQKVEKLPPKPKHFNEMLNCSRLLSKPFPFVRIDYYDLDDRLVFGEMTFFPHGCVGMSEIIIDGKTMGEILDVK